MNAKTQDVVIIATVCCVTVLSVFLTGATNVAIATIGKDLRFKQEDLKWPLNIYSLSYGCFLLLCGRLADIVGSRRMFLIGSLWFGIWSIAAALAKDPVMFIIFLGLQGLGSAANTPAGISIISSHFPPGRSKGKAFAILGARQPIGFIIGMILGGLLTESKASWRTIFWLQSGLALLLCVVGWLALPADDGSRRYTEGLDWIGALLSTSGLGLLVYDSAESTAAPHGWATPFVPSLFGTAIILTVSFVLWEIRREAKNQSVLPMSMWMQPGAKLGPTILMVFFGWWGFNTLCYLVPLFYQEVQLLSPMQTAIRLVPMGGLIANIVTGYVVALVPGQVLVVLGLLCAWASSIIFAFIRTQASYWAMAFVVSMLLPTLDIAYTVANIQVCSGFPAHSQALAGSIFSVATRLGTSIGLAVTSTIANAVSTKYNRGHPQLVPSDPLVLLAGFHAAGWVCCGVLVLSLIVGLIGMREIGLVGQHHGRGSIEKSCRRQRDIELATASHTTTIGVVNL